METIAAPVNGPRHKGLSRLLPWQRSSKTAPLDAPREKPKMFIQTYPFSASKQEIDSKKKAMTVPLRETAKGEVYKLSTINDLGVFMPPSPCEDSKRDHWLDIDQEELVFRLPSPDCLTTHSGGAHSFFTPSATIKL